MPVIMLYSTKELAKYKVPNAENVSKDDLIKFVNDWKAGNLKPYVQSEGIPYEKVHKNGLTRVVGDSW